MPKAEGRNDAYGEPHSSLFISFSKPCTSKDFGLLHPLENNNHDACLKNTLLYFGKKWYLDISWHCLLNTGVSGYDGCSLLKSELIAIETGCSECVVCWNTRFPAWLLFMIILCISWRSIWSFFACLSESLSVTLSVPLLDLFLMPPRSCSWPHEFQKSDWVFSFPFSGFMNKNQRTFMVALCVGINDGTTLNGFISRLCGFQLLNIAWFDWQLGLATMQKRYKQY